MLRLTSLATTFALTVATAINGQTTATIEGLVRDATGAIVAGATVQAVSSRTGTLRTTTVGTDAIFRLLGLAPGVDLAFRPTVAGPPR